MSVDPDTVFQFIGLYDKNDVKIFENDVVHVIKNKFREGRHEVWRIQYGSFGDAQFYVFNGVNSNREIECEQDVYFSKNGEDKTLLEVQKIN